VSNSGTRTDRRGFEERGGLFVVKLGMLSKDVGDVHRQGTIDEDRETRDGLGLDQFVQQQDQLLRTADGEGGHDDLAAPSIGAIHDLGELGRYGLDGLMHAVAVGAFHNQVVGWRQRLGVADDGQPGPP
jgi:hypothetical protein